MLHNIDMNKMNRVMKENEDAKEIISQLLSNHQTVISTISHELRNPLTLVSSALQIIEAQHPEVKEFSNWEPTMENIHFICQLLSELSSFNNGGMLRPSVFSIEKLLKNIAISFAISLDEEDSDIEFTSSIPNLGEFTGDRIKLEQVILNLLINARDSITGEGTIQMIATRDEEHLIIRVIDSGCGIPEENLESIFEPFKTTKSSGTGLGLALSRKIIEAHEGRLSVSSVLNSGSTFSIFLPV